MCSGGTCFQSTFGVAAALCVALALLPTIVLLWVSTYGPKAAAAKESLAMQVGYEGRGGAKESLAMQVGHEGRGGAKESLTMQVGHEGRGGAPRS